MQNVLTKKGLLAEFNTAARNQDWKSIQKYMDTYHTELNAEIKKVAKKAGDKDWQSATFDGKVRDEAKDILDEIFVEAREDASMDIGYINSFIPRLLKKGAYKQMRKYMDENGMSQEINDLDRALEEYAARMDVPVEALSDMEKVEVASRVLGTKPRGTKTSHEKSRVFEQVDDRLADFYEDILSRVLATTLTLWWSVLSLVSSWDSRSVRQMNVQAFALLILVEMYCRILTIDLLEWVRMYALTIHLLESLRKLLGITLG
jgi:hypothetical protein